MNKKVVCFICKVDAPFNGNSLNTGLGGSETWTLQMANKFANNGYHVIVFNDIQQHMIYGQVLVDLKHGHYKWLINLLITDIM